MKLTNVPPCVSFLATKPNVLVPPKTLDLKPKKFHVKCTNHVTPDYYENYVMTTTYSETMQDLQKEQALKLFNYYGHPQSIVEIGCGDGSFLKHCHPLFKDIVGIEPSKRFIAEAKKTGFKIIHGYVSSRKLLTSQKFDCFASRQVFEHLEDPVDVLKGIKKMLEPKAVGLIEVPSGYRAMRMGRFYEFFPDHIHYYSVNSLVNLATKANFNVISCNESFGGDYLELWLRNGDDDNLNSLVATRDALCEAIDAFLAKNKDTIVFGAGAKTLCILTNLANVNQITCVVDDDPHKWGRFIPNTSIPITARKSLADYEPETVFIMSLSYVEEATKKIKALAPKAKIFTINERNGIVQIR